MNASEKVDTLFAKYCEYFAGSFHNLLWQLFVNEVRKPNGIDIRTALTLIIPKGEHIEGLSYELALADFDCSGYTPTMTWFRTDNHPEMKKWDTAKAIVELMNKDFFDLSAKEACVIVASTMRKRGS